MTTWDVLKQLFLKEYGATKNAHTLLNNLEALRLGKNESITSFQARFEAALSPCRKYYTDLLLYRAVIKMFPKEFITSRRTNMKLLLLNAEELLAKIIPKSREN